MKRVCVTIGALAPLGLAAVGVGQVAVPDRPLLPSIAVETGSPRVVNRRPAPPTPQEIARNQRALAEAYRYKGTTVAPDRGLDPDDNRVKVVCALLARADFVPAQRVQAFSVLDPRFIVVGWHLVVTNMEVRTADSLVRVRVTPILRVPGDGAIIVSSAYFEEYRIIGGRPHYLGGASTLPDSPIQMMAIE